MILEKKLLQFFQEPYLDDQPSHFLVGYLSFTVFHSPFDFTSGWCKFTIVKYGCVGLSVCTYVASMEMNEFI